MRMKYVLATIAALALVLLPLSLTAMEKEANTIDQLMEMFDESSCMECHEDIHNEWVDSWHAKTHRVTEKITFELD